MNCGWCHGDGVRYVTGEGDQTCPCVYSKPAEEPLSPEARAALDRGIESARQGRIKPAPSFAAFLDDEDVWPELPMTLERLEHIEAREKYQWEVGNNNDIHDVVYELRLRLEKEKEAAEALLAAQPDVVTDAGGRVHGTPGNALQIIGADRDEWKKRALEAEAENNRDADRLHFWISEAQDQGRKAQELARERGEWKKRALEAEDALMQATRVLAQTADERDRYIARVQELEARLEEVRRVVK